MRRLARALLAVLALSAPAAMAQPALDPRGAQAKEQLARCADAGRGRSLDLVFAGLPPFAREVLARHALRARIDSAGGGLHIELRLENLRQLDTPDSHPATQWLTGRDASALLLDGRSAIGALWMLDEATVQAADRAYDIRHDAGEIDAGRPPRLLPSRLGPEALTDYRILRIYTDAYTGFAGLVLEALPRPGRAPHRIYAIAGTHVLAHRDFRSWASGLTMGRAQMVSSAALRMAGEAASYAASPSGGEVVITGQSQGGLVAQGLGFLVQSLVQAGPAPHRLVHVVSWGAAGAEETVLRLLHTRRQGEERGFPPALEAHWAATDPDWHAAMQVWSALGRAWAAIPPGQEQAWLWQTTRRMRALGYFFDIDLFARGGTFLGDTLAFPTALILPEACDTTVIEAVIGYEGGMGVRLESHFLQGYRRAVARGAIALARPAVPAKWRWVDHIMPTMERIGYLWLEKIYLEGIAGSPHNWRRCQARREWQTPANASCRAGFWPGCSTEEAAWCLAKP